MNYELFVNQKKISAGTKDAVAEYIKRLRLSVRSPSFHAKKLRSLFRMRITSSFFPIRQALRPYPPNSLHPRSTG